MIVSTRFFRSHWPIALSSRLLVAVTAASSTCHAAHDPDTSLSTYGYVTLALVARSRNSGIILAAPGLFVNGGCSSKTVTDSAFLPAGATASGPGAGNRWKCRGGV